MAAGRGANTKRDVVGGKEWVLVAVAKSKKKKGGCHNVEAPAPWVPVHWTTTVEPNMQ